MKMEGSGKNDRKGAEGSRKKAVSRTVKAGLKFPVGTIVARYLKKERYTKPFGRDAAIYIAAVLEYLAAEVLELAGNAARDGKNTRISTCHIQRAIRNDDELAELFAKVSGKLPPVSLQEVENMVTQFSSFELNENDGVS